LGNRIFEIEMHDAGKLVGGRGILKEALIIQLYYDVGGS